MMHFFVGILILILILSVILLSWRLILLRRSIKKTADELLLITEELEENRVLHLPAPQRELEELLVVINRNLQAIRMQRRTYQEKERSLKEQVENISHDLRTPLTAILGYLKMIDQTKLSQKDQEYLAIAVRKSHALQTLISAFYELSRVSAEDFRMNMERLDGARLLRECCLEQYSLFEKEKKELQIEIPDRPVFVFADREALERIFANLLQNGVRYAKSELRISIEPEKEGRGASIVFQNDIDPSQEENEPERLFDRFYMQEHSRGKGGTGLGLTISRHLAQHMGGTLRASYVSKEKKRYLALTVRLRG